MPKPHVLLVPGAFVGPENYAALSTELASHGYGVTTISHLSKDPIDPSTATPAGDVAHLRDTHILPLLAQGADVLLFAHSYGGNISGGAAKGLSRTARRQEGLHGGVVGLICCSCPLVSEGGSVEQMMGGFPPSIVRDDPRPGLCSNTVSNTSHALAAFTAPMPRPEWADGELDGTRIYLRTVGDNAFPEEAQDGFIKSSGAAWESRDLQTGHDAPRDDPQAVAKEIERLAERAHGS